MAKENPTNSNYTSKTVSGFLFTLIEWPMQIIPEEEPHLGYELHVSGSKDVSKDAQNPTFLCQPRF